MTTVRPTPEVVAAVAAGGAEARRIAADWLLERGEERGEYILDELTLAERPNPSTRRATAQRLRARVQNLEQWGADLVALGVRRWRFRGGFIDEVALPEASLPALPRMLELEPITRLRVDCDGSGQLALAMRLPAFARIRALDVLGAPRFERHEGLESLTLRTNEADVIEHVVECFPALKTLGVSFWRLGDEAVQAVASGRLPVRRLWARRAGVENGSLTALAQSSTPLEALDVSDNWFDAAALETLGASRTLASLSALALVSSGDTDGFLSREGLPGLRRLGVSWQRREDRKLYAERGIVVGWNPVPASGQPAWCGPR